MRLICITWMARLAAACAIGLMAHLPGAWAASEHETLAAGSWYGEVPATADQPLQRFMTQRQPDGTFTLLTRLYQNGRAVSELRNAGLWGVSNGLYFTITTEINGKRTETRTTELSNAYLIRSLTAEAFEYQHIASGRMFRVKRVDPAITRLPD
ncbi:MAG: hypothetical protein AB7P37_01840 [Ramlibacter sp.]